MVLKYMYVEILSFMPTGLSRDLVAGQTAADVPLRSGRLIPFGGPFSSILLYYLYSTV